MARGSDINTVSNHCKMLKTFKLLQKKNVSKRK